MPFDPSMIRRPRPASDGTPEGASREERVLSLANTLLERKLASSLASAKRLAEGMVDTERKILDQGSRRDDVAAHGASSERERFQRGDSTLFKAVGGKAVRTLSLPEPLERFVEKARSARPAAAPAQPSAAAPRQAFSPLSQVSERAPAAQPRMAEAAQRWQIPERTGEGGYAKTSLEASESGVVLHHVEARGREDVTVERGVIFEGPAAAAPAPQAPPPAEKREDLAKQHGVDLFNIFRASSSK